MILAILKSDDRLGHIIVAAFWSTRKYELVYHHRFGARAEASTAIFDYIEIFYNRARLHSSLDDPAGQNFESKLN